MQNSELLNNNTDLDTYSNFQLFGIGKPSPKQMAKRESKATPTEKTTGCIKPKIVRATVGGLLVGGGIAQIAILNKYKKDMKAYNKCLEDYTRTATSTAQEKAALQQELANSKKELELAYAQQQQLPKTDQQSEKTIDDSSNDSSNKILGMPKGLVIGIGVALGLAIAGFITYKIVKAKRG